MPIQWTSRVVTLRFWLRAMLRPLYFRPLLWMAFCAVAGVALGSVWASFWMQTPRDSARWWIFLPLVPLLLAFAWQVRERRLLPRAFVGLAIVAFFASHTVRRVLPTASDVSWLVNGPARRDVPVYSTKVKVRGLVVDYPKRGEWQMEFPLQVAQVSEIGSTTQKSYDGQIWISAPVDSPVEIGDEIEFECQLQPLGLASNPGERARFWPQILANCWCVGSRTKNLHVVESGAAFGLERRVQKIRHAILARFDASFRGAGDRDTLAKYPFPAQNASLLTAMVFGENGLETPLPRALRDDFRAAGLSHILVASGTQVVVAIGLILLLGRFLLRRWGLIIAVIIGGIAYAILVGAAPSIWRATAFGILATLCLVYGRDLDGLSLWGAALLGLLTLDPALAWSLSLQLTFAAVWGLLVVSPLILHWLQAWGRGRFVEGIAFSLGAQMATWPIAVFQFGSASVAGLGANLVAVPLAGVLVLSGSLGLFLPMGWVNYRLTQLVGDVASLGAKMPGARVDSVTLSLSGAWWLYAVLLLMMLPLSEGYGELKRVVKSRVQRQLATVKSWSPWSVCGWLGAVCLLATLWMLWPSPNHLRITMLDVGQGESLLIQSSDGRNALIDGGSLDERGDVGKSVIVPALNALGVEKLDYLVLTHADADHCNGLASVAREIAVGAFIDGVAAGDGGLTGNETIDPTASDYLKLRRELERQKVQRYIPRDGQVFGLGTAHLRVLAPSLPLFNDRNDNALVLRAEWGQRTVMLTADIEKETELRLASRGASLKCDVLKVAHHGSKTSSTGDFLRLAAPGAAIISCGRYNSFGHPSPETLDVFASRHIPVYRTDLDGALFVTCDPDACQVTTTN